MDFSTPKGRIVAALLRLAAERPWQDIVMLDIADAAGISLADLRREFERKAQILSSFGHMVDAEVMAKAPRRTPGQGARDAIFDVVMSRFDALAPYRAALKSAARGGAIDAALVKSLLRSQTVMLQVAGVETEGPLGKARVLGLAAVFTRVFHVWLDDEDPSMPRTMAALDRQLRSGERTLETVSGACKALSGVKDVFRRRSGGTGKPAEPSAPSAANETATPA